jgi:hypothetical protein
MNKFLLILLALAFTLPAGAAEIAILHGGVWTTVAHTTSGGENTAGLYYQNQEMDGLCAVQNLAAGCTKAQYEAACPAAETPACETFYSRDALGGKEWFMDKIIKLNLTGMVVSRENDIDTRGRDYWNGLSLAEKEAQCIAWGKAADCS